MQGRRKAIKEVANMSSCYALHHPKRGCVGIGGNKKAYFDEEENHCPYIWNNRFLHTFCQGPFRLNPYRGQIIFWVSKIQQKGKKMTALNCDLVFVVDEIHTWKNPNKISNKCNFVESNLIFNEHYKFGNAESGDDHYLRKRSRITLKAHPTLSFQPQAKNGELINVLPFFHVKEISKLRKKFSNQNARRTYPFDMTLIRAIEFYDWISSKAHFRILGREFKKKKPKELE